MLSALLAFLGSLIYGGSDFFGGLAASRMSAIKVTAINAIGGVALLLVASVFIDGRWSGGVFLWGGLGGLAGAASLGLLICFVPDARAVRPSVKALLMAAGAGLAVGLYLVFIDRTPRDSGISPLIVTFAVSGIVMGAILLVQHLAGRIDPAEGARSRRQGLLGRARSAPTGTVDVIATSVWRSPVALVAAAMLALA